MKYIENKNVKKVPVYFICILVLIFTILIIALLYNKKCADSDLVNINQNVKCTQVVVDKKSYVAFKKNLDAFIDKKQSAGEVEEVAIYFRDLQYGPTFGLNEYALYSPASLLKVPMMITYYGLSENNPEILNKQIYFQGYKDEIYQSIPPQFSAKENINYTIRELVDYMIKYSDNNSYYALLGYIDSISPNKQLLRDTFIDLGVIDPKSNFDQTITVKSYASIFTQLYNSSFFEKKQTSDKVLEILSDTDFDEGLVAGVPDDIKVAHKFGERFNADRNINQLHDCGIVYYPKNPYLLCVMTMGDNMEKLKTIIADISNMVYVEFDSRKE